MSDKQPEALRLADAWDAAITSRAHVNAGCAMADKLRSQHTLITDMRDAMQMLITHPYSMAAKMAAQAVMAKAEAQQ